MKKILIFICIILLTACSNTKIEKELEYNEKVTINVGESLPLVTKYIEGYDDLTINWDNIEEEKVYIAGTYNGHFTIDDKTYNVYLEVVDNESPTINNVKDITTIEGTKVDLLSNIEVKDNSKDKLDISIDGDYDFNKVGTYNLSVVAIDKSNNKSIKDFKLIVEEKPKPIVVETKPKETITTSSNVVDKDLSGTTTKGYQISRINGIYYIKGIMIANKTYALPNTYNPGGLTSEFNTAFNKMKSDAAKEGISLWVASGYRSYSYQSKLYSQYANSYGKASADTFSARAGHSEHQTGLAADLNQISESFGNTKEGKWLANNCYKYGFILRYPKNKQSITGYIYEPWHFRYIGEEASNLYNNGEWTTLEEYLGIDSKYSY